MYKFKCQVCGSSRYIDASNEYENRRLLKKLFGYYRKRIRIIECAKCRQSRVIVTEEEFKNK